MVQKIQQFLHDTDCLDQWCSVGGQNLGQGKYCPASPTVSSLESYHSEMAQRPCLLGHFQACPVVKAQGQGQGQGRSGKVQISPLVLFACLLLADVAGLLGGGRGGVDHGCLTRLATFAEQGPKMPSLFSLSGIAGQGPHVQAESCSCWSSWF